MIPAIACSFRYGLPPAGNREVLLSLGSGRRRILARSVRAKSTGPWSRTGCRRHSQATPALFTRMSILANDRRAARWRTNSLYLSRQPLLGLGADLRDQPTSVAGPQFQGDPLPVVGQTYRGRWALRAAAP